jgi:hypothetical protein|tara:strand:- start:555 stop:866 length:312 start_codon:yes stop_codon:yes gene_type:complete
MTDNKNETMTNKELNDLASRIVAKMMHLKTMEDWFEHARDSETAADDDYFSLELSEEYKAYGETAKLLTLLNLFQEDENYEVCAIIKRRLDAVNKILDKYDET